MYIQKNKKKKLNDFIIVKLRVLNIKKFGKTKTKYTCIVFET